MGKFCPSWGAEVTEQAVVCIKCGAALNGKNTMAFINGTQQPKTWLVESILVTLFCCLPFGIAGIINAANVSSRFAAGDIEEASRASAQAGKWTKWAFWMGLILYVISLIIYLIAGVALLGAVGASL
jgi:hypothetical protein